MAQEPAKEYFEVTLCGQNALTSGYFNVRTLFGDDADHVHLLELKIVPNRKEKQYMVMARSEQHPDCYVLEKGGVYAFATTCTPYLPTIESIVNDPRKNEINEMAESAKNNKPKKTAAKRKTNDDTVEVEQAAEGHGTVLAVTNRMLAQAQTAEEGGNNDPSKSQSPRTKKRSSPIPTVMDVKESALASQSAVNGPGNLRSKSPSRPTGKPATAKTTMETGKPTTQNNNSVQLPAGVVVEDSGAIAENGSKMEKHRESAKKDKRDKKDKTDKKEKKDKTDKKEKKHASKRTREEPTEGDITEATAPAQRVLEASVPVDEANSARKNEGGRKSTPKETANQTELSSQSLQPTSQEIITTSESDASPATRNKGRRLEMDSSPSPIVPGSAIPSSKIAILPHSVSRHKKATHMPPPDAVAPVPRPQPKIANRASPTTTERSGNPQAAVAAAAIFPSSPSLSYAVPARVLKLPKLNESSDDSDESL